MGGGVVSRRNDPGRLPEGRTDSSRLDGWGRVPVRQADLIGANLQGADLAFADLTQAKDLTREQLDEACGDDETTLPDYLADYQMKPCPTPEQPTSN